MDELDTFKEIIAYTTISKTCSIIYIFFPLYNTKT